MEDCFQGYCECLQFIELEKFFRGLEIYFNFSFQVLRRIIEYDCIKYFLKDLIKVDVYVNLYYLFKVGKWIELNVNIGLINNFRYKLFFGDWEIFLG